MRQSILQFASVFFLLNASFDDQMMYSSYIETCRGRFIS